MKPLSLLLFVLLQHALKSLLEILIAANINKALHNPLEELQSLIRIHGIHNRFFIARDVNILCERVPPRLRLICFAGSKWLWLMSVYLKVTPSLNHNGLFPFKL
jgi:hypothetical protein